MGDILYKPAEPAEQQAPAWPSRTLPTPADLETAASASGATREIHVTRSPPGPPGTEGRATSHFLQVLREFGDVDALLSPHVQGIFPRAAFLDVCRTYAVAPEMARAIELGYVDYTKAIRDGWLQRLWMWTQNFDIVEDDIPLHFGNPLPIAELHCPHVDGAKTWLRRAKKIEKEMKLDVTIGALGGGGTFRREFEVETSVTTEGACQALLAEVSGSASIWRHLDSGEQICLLSITNVSGQWSPQQIPDDDPLHPSHVCSEERDLEPIKEGLKRQHAVVDEDYCHVRPEPSPRPKATVGGKLEMADERVYEAQWRIVSTEIGVGLISGIGTVSITSKFRHEIEWGFEFKAGPEFLGLYPSPERWPLHWAWKPSSAKPGT
jgi:hypothetical protein